MQPSAKDYPDLATLLSGWFHQDFDIEGDTIEEIIRAFKGSCSSKEHQALVIDITHFLEINDDKIESQFLRIFDPDIDPLGFAPTTRAFLEEILSYLKKAPE